MKLDFLASGDELRGLREILRKGRFTICRFLLSESGIRTFC